MLTRQKYYWNPPTFEVAGAGVLRVFQEAVFEALFGERSLVADNPWDQAHDRVGQHQRRKLASSQDVVPYRDLVIDAILDEALIDALVVPANDDERGLPGKLPREPLIEKRSLRGHENRPRSPAAGVEPGRFQHVRLHHHSLAAAERRVVDRAMLVRGEIADLHGLVRDEPARGGLT